MSPQHLFTPPDKRRLAAKNAKAPPLDPGANPGGGAIRSKHFQQIGASAPKSIYSRVIARSISVWALIIIDVSALPAAKYPNLELPRSTASPAVVIRKPFSSVCISQRARARYLPSPRPNHRRPCLPRQWPLRLGEDLHLVR